MTALTLKKCACLQLSLTWGLRLRIYQDFFCRPSLIFLVE